MSQSIGPQLDGRASVRSAFHRCVVEQVAGLVDVEDAFSVLRMFLSDEVDSESVSAEIVALTHTDPDLIPPDVQVVGDRTQLASSNGYSFGIVCLAPSSIIGTPITETSDYLFTIVPRLGDATPRNSNEDGAFSSGVTLTDNRLGARALRLGDALRLEAGAHWSMRNAGSVGVVVAYVQSPESLGSVQRFSVEGDALGTGYVASVRRRLLWCDLATRLDPEDAATLLLRLTDDREPIVRWTAVRSLGEVDPNAARAKIRLMVGDQDPRIRDVATTVSESLDSESGPDREGANQ